MSLKLYTDVGLTTLFGGSLSLLHYTNLSDGSQDTQLWLGSNTSGVQFTAVSNPGVDQITLTPTDILPEWEAATAYVVGNSVEPTTPNGFRYECTTAGTSHAVTEPTWPLTPVGSTVTDGTVTWTLRGASHQTSEIKLALTSGGLAAAVAGAALDVGTSIDGGVAGAVEVNIRVTNAVTIVSNNSGTPEISIDVNNIQERSV